ncbi:MAG: T9SS type A sorting domain-containing protein [Flavobacteriales bacterium]|nr:T9SS type A sorting domain-containing protein [Flavobacteriales bacterium]
MRNLSLISLSLVLFFCFKAEAQIQNSEFPPSFYSQKKVISSQNFRVNVAKPNLSSFAAQDIIEDPIKNIPWRFGALVPVDYSIQNSGVWTDDDNTGLSTWNLKIVAKEALSINLNFNDFSLIPTSKLFIYNADYSDVLGALSSINNKEDRKFSIRPIKGSSISLELIVPTQEKNQIALSINELIYGYRDIHPKIRTIFQSSGNCNVNVNCSEGDNWQDIKRSVVMITTSFNTRICTGALINNALQDSTPFFLTAAHCSVRNNSIFIFGYESPNCSPNTDGITTNSISGSSRRAIATGNSSDFELRVLSTTPPLSYNVFYAGWSNVNIPSTGSTGIHHPRGDVMKISVDTDAPTNSSYYAPGTTHWQVSNWEVGTTEGGSSGSPLFDQNQRITGQLEGGDAACGNRAQDYFGKFSYSWNTNPDTARQLKHWLDPNNTGITVIDGLDPNPAVNNIDLALLKIDGIDDFICATSIQPSLIIRNIGNNPIDSFYVDYQLNSGTVQSILYTISLNRQQVTTILLPSLTPMNGANTFNVTVRVPSPLVDQNLTNNLDSNSFIANSNINPTEIVVTVKTDNYGSETSWDLLEINSNSLLYSSDAYPNVNGGLTYRDTLCIYNDCFRFNLYDSRSDGFNDLSGNFGNGYALITLLGTDTLFFENTFFSALSTDTFCIPITTSQETSITQTDDLSIYPNPILKGNILTVGDTSMQLKLYSKEGKLIIEENTQYLTIPSQLSSGVYFLEVINQNNQRVNIKKVLVQ